MDRESNYRELFDEAPVPYLETDEKGQLRAANRAACKYFGYSHEALLTLRLVDLVAPSDRKAYKRQFPKRLAGMMSNEPFERRFVHANGFILYAEVHFTRICRADGVPLGLRVAYVDLTARRVAESTRTGLVEDLEMHRARWETILRQLPGGVLVVDSMGRPMLTNDHMQMFLKRSIPDLESLSFGGFVPGWRSSSGSPCPVDRWPPLRCLTDSEVIIREEMVYDVDEMSQVFVEVSASPIRGKRGEVIAVACLFFDITEQRLNDISSRRSESRYRAIFEQDVAANFIFTRRLDLVACNNAAVSLFGFSSKNQILAAAAAGEFPLPADRAAVQARAMESPPALESRYMRLHRRDGAPILINGTLRAVRDNEGQVIEIHGHFVDVTERRRAERKVASLSTQLLNVQNEERRKLSLDLHDSSGQDLSALSMNLGLIEANLQEHPDKALQYLAESKELVQACIRDIRTISYTLHPPLLDELGLSAALKWFIEGFSNRSSIQVELDVMENLGRLGTLVEISLFRIVQEALTNVHRHSGSKTATVRIWRDATQLTLIVADRGRGIRASATSPDRPSAGVGLASIRQQLAYVDGSLEIIPGPGTQLRATIPTKAMRNSPL